MTTEKRVADLQPGDLTINAGGSCTCVNPYAPWRVEKLEPWGDGPGLRTAGDGIDVTWSHPCGEVSWLPCDPDCPVTFYGRSE